MPITYSTTVKDARMTVVRDAVDGTGGSPNEPGRLQIGNLGFALVLAEFTFSFPCGTVSGGVLTFSGMPKETTALNTGTAAEGRFMDSHGAVVASGIPVGTAGTNIIIISTLTVTSGNALTLNSAAITHSLV
jgi:hypothetical protein